MRLFKTILLLMLVASVIPTLMVGLLSVSDTRELLVRDAQELMQERAKQLLLKTQNVLEEPTRAVLGLGRFGGFVSLPEPERRAQLATVLNQNPELIALTVFDPQGERVPGLQAFAVKDLPPTELAEHEATARGLLPGLRGLAYSTVRPSRSRNQPVVTLAFALEEGNEGFVGAELSLTNLSELLRQERLGSAGFAYVVDRHGRVVAGREGFGPGLTGDDVSSRPAVAHLRETLKSSGEAQLLHVGNFGSGAEQVVAAYSYLPEVGWAVVSEQPIALAYRQVAALERRVLLVILAAFAVALALAAIFSRTLTRPLKGFIAGALELAKGKFGVEVPVTTKNELGELAQTFNYMSKQLDAYNQETGRLYQSLEMGYLETIVALANSIDSKDAYTRGHSQRVGDLSMEIGRELGLTDREVKLLHYGGILHDIGKIGVVDSILSKQSRLTDEEMQQMREHPAIGDAIVQPITFLASVRTAVRNHHERYDGTGYPDRLKGEEIPLIARIVAAADTWDACTTTRPYQQALPLNEALEILQRLRGPQLDPQVVDALVRVIHKRMPPVAVPEAIQLAS